MRPEVVSKAALGFFFGGVGDLLHLYQVESTQIPDSYIFIALQTAGRDGDTVMITGAVAVIRMDTLDEVTYMVEQRPKNGVYFVVKNGEVVDSSERFFKVEEEPQEIEHSGVTPRMNALGHTLH